MAGKPLMSMKVIRKKFKEGLVKANLRAIYRAYTEFNRKGYLGIISEAPVSTEPSERFPAGMVKSHIKLVIKRAPPYVYEEVDVPERDRPRSLAWRTWVIIQTLHGGWTSLPFERRPTRKQAMSLPLYPGRIYPPGQTRTLVSKAVQRKQIQKNPWIPRVWKRIEPQFPGMLEEAIRRQPKKKKVTRNK